MRDSVALVLVATACACACALVNAAAAPDLTPPPMPSGTPRTHDGAPVSRKEAEAVADNNPPHQISIEFDATADLAIGDRLSGKPHKSGADAAAEGDDGHARASQAAERPYFASYDATELSRMYSSFSSLTEAVPGQPVWDGHDLTRHPQPMSDTRASVRTVEVDHHRPAIDAHGNVQPMAPHEAMHTQGGSMKGFIADKRDMRADEKEQELAAEAAKAKAKAQAEEERKRDAALAAAKLLMRVIPGSDGAKEVAAEISATARASAEGAAAIANTKGAAPATATATATALVPGADEKLRIARDIFRKQNADGVVKELTPLNVMFYVSRNQPFALFLLCDCADDYDLAVAVEELAPKLLERGHPKRMLFLSVSPQIAGHFNLWNVFALQAPPVGQGPLHLGANDILVGDSKSSNTKTVAVTFAAADQNKYAAVSAVITNECCGDKFVLRVEHLDGTGFHVTVERIENKDQPGWGQQLVVRWAGEVAGEAHDKAEKEAEEEKRVPKLPAVVIDNIPMGSMNEKYVFSRGHAGPIEARALLAFFDDFWALKLPLFIRSQTPAALAPGTVAPASKPGDVMAVYGNTFREVVLNRQKDVLVLVYSPFCGGSHAVMPVFEQTALALSKETNVQLVKFDKTQNDFPVRGIKIIHYPTVLLFPAGDFSTEEYSFYDFDDYNGSKTPHQREVPHSHYSVNALVQFVHEKGQMVSGSGQHFHLSGPNSHGTLHSRHPGDPTPSGGHGHDHDHDHSHDHGHDHSDV